MPIVEFLYPSAGGMEPATPEDLIYMSVDKANEKRLTHPLMDQYIEQRPLPDRTRAAWSIFRVYMNMLDLKEKLEATVEALGGIGLVKANSEDLGIRTYEIKRNLLDLFGVWTSSKVLDEILEDLRRGYKAEEFQFGYGPNPFTEFCDLLYEIRAHNLDNPLLTIVERSGGDPMENDGE